MSDASIGYGASFSMGSTASPATLVALAEVFSLSPPNEQADDVEVTHYKSPGRTREYIQGLIESGEADIQMNYAPGSPTDILIRGNKSSGAVVDYMIEVLDSDGDIWEITGQLYVKGYARDIPVDDRMTATATVKFTGSSAEAAAS